MMKHAKKFTPVKIGEEKIDKNFQSIDTEFDNLARIVNSYLVGSTAWDPGSIADGDEEAKEVTVTGAALGDFVLASFSLDVADLVLNAQVTSANVVTAILSNNTGIPIDLASGTLYIRVIK